METRHGRDDRLEPPGSGGRLEKGLGSMLQPLSQTGAAGRSQEF